MAKAYIIVVGVILVLSGLAGFVDNPIVGDPANEPILATDALHNIVHLATGLLGLWIGLGMAGDRVARGVIWFGWLYIVLFVVLLLSPDLFGLLTVDVNNADHFLHGALGVVSLLVGFVARQTTGASPARA